MIDPELSALEIVGIAVRAEREAFDLYDSLAKRVSNPKLVKELEELARQEKEHEQWLAEYYREATGLEEAPAVPDVRIQIFGPEVHDGMSVIEVLGVAVEKEHAAERVYAEAARRARDASGRRLLEKLVDFERGHARKLQAQLDRARRDPAWLEDAGGRTIQLEGP